MYMSRISVAILPLLFLTAGVVGCATRAATPVPQTADRERPRIESSDDLPRHTYPVATAHPARPTAVRVPVAGDLVVEGAESR